MFGTFKNGVTSGVLAGLLWGWVSMLVNSISGAFPFEHTILHNLVVFSAGGIIFGIIIGGFLTLLGERLPFHSVLPKAVLVSTSFWLLLRLGGLGLAMTEPERYHPDIPQTAQGLVLAVTLGIILSFFWKKDPANSTR
jgi:hypothetical protein